MQRLRQRARRRGRLAPAREHHVACSSTRTCGSSACAPPPRRSRSCQQSTFDCVVMDLNLPDLSGYALLEKMAASDDVSFPPVIVYTGRSLTRDEEQRAAPVLEVDHRQGRALAGAPARRGDAVPAPGRVEPAGRAPAHAARGAQPRVGARRAAHPGRRGRRAQHLRAVERARAQGREVAIARNGREALEALEKSRVGAEPRSTSC